MKSGDVVFNFEVDAAELAVRMCEASYRLTRPVPDPVLALAAMDEDVCQGWLRAAEVATQYFVEKINTSNVWAAKAQKKEH